MIVTKYENRFNPKTGKPEKKLVYAYEVCDATGERLNDFDYTTYNADQGDIEEPSATGLYEFIKEAVGRNAIQEDEDNLYDIFNFDTRDFKYNEHWGGGNDASSEKGYKGDCFKYLIKKAEVEGYDWGNLHCLMIWGRVQVAKKLFQEGVMTIEQMLYDGKIEH